VLHLVRRQTVHLEDEAGDAYDRLGESLQDALDVAQDDGARAQEALEEVGAQAREGEFGAIRDPGHHVNFGETI